MLIYVPPKNKKNTVISFLGILCGCVFFAASYFINQYAAVVQLAALGFWTFGFWVACRYALVSYYYAIDGINFQIVKVMGKKQQTVGNISMRTGVFLKKLSEAKDRPPVRNRFNYSTNFSGEKYVYAFEWNGTSAEIIFEPDEHFAAVMQEKLTEIKNSPAEEPTNGWYDE